ncbi:MAG: peptide deformylase [Candidatus Omnitrophica bacterium]|nr:peptide deformylase [Candidatus Omnitrophota bacterium]
MSKTKLRIHTWPEKILRKKCKKIKVVDDSIRSQLSEMLTLMRVTDGFGLAGNQAGLDASLIVVGIEDSVFKLVNPKIIKREGSISFPEGCLSFPGLEMEVKRDNKILISALNENGKKVEIEVEGVLSVIFQHEIDHIEGKVFIDRVSFLKRLQIAPKLAAITRRTRNVLRKQEKKH